MHNFKLSFIVRWNLQVFSFDSLLLAMPYLLILYAPTFQVNKPYLPLASGEYSVRTGVTVVLVSAIMVC